MEKKPAPKPFVKFSLLGSFYSMDRFFYDLNVKVSTKLLFSLSTIKKQCSSIDFLPFGALAGEV